MKWFGEDDPAPDRVAGAVHFLADPVIRDTGILLSIDMGTAPVEAFDDLLDTLAVFGAQDLHVGQFADPS